MRSAPRVSFQLGQGTLVQVSPSLVKRRKTHFHNLPCGASVILGNNGYVWISPTISEDTDNTGGLNETAFTFIAGGAAKPPGVNEGIASGLPHCDLGWLGSNKRILGSPWSGGAEGALSELWSQVDIYLNNYLPIQSEV